MNDITDQQPFQQAKYTLQNLWVNGERIRLLLPWCNVSTLKWIRSVRARFKPEWKGNKIINLGFDGERICFDSWFGFNLRRKQSMNLGWAANIYCDLALTQYNLHIKYTTCDAVLMLNGLTGLPFSFFGFAVSLFTFLLFFAKMDAGFNASSSLPLPPWEQSRVERNRYTQ